MAKLVPLGVPRRLRRWGALKASQARIDAAFMPETEAQVARLLDARRK